ncbi:MAG: AAA family ATPase [Blastocatellia bacterium]|nr:AAA family ATPase [Blastocatellia bacterium]
MAKRGLIVGKFYPPHRGHKFLIDAGRAQVDQLSVIVCQKPNEQPPGNLRAAWLREIHPDVNVLLIDDVYDEQDSRVWAENSIRWLGFAPDVVFTSEEYGDRFAHYLGCQHMLVDQARNVVSVSGTKVRSNAMQYWEFLEPPVRGWYAKRVCLVGAESTGKTTLARGLAAHYQTVWVPEYGREYSERKLAETGSYDFTSEEFTHIAATQCERENAAARECNRILICDTDAFATSIWHRRYLHERSPAVEAIVAAHRGPDMYLLTDVHTPFEQDGTRDGEAIREWMHAAFVEELTAQQRPFQFLSGTASERLANAIAMLDDLVRYEER